MWVLRGFLYPTENIPNGSDRYIANLSNSGITATSVMAGLGFAYVGGAQFVLSLSSDSKNLMLTCRAADAPANQWIHMFALLST